MVFVAVAGYLRLLLLENIQPLHAGSWCAAAVVTHLLCCHCDVVALNPSF